MPKLLPAIQSYFDDLSPERLKRLRALHDRILKRFPRAELSMRYRMPTYELNGAWMSIASQKSYVSVYTCQRPHIEPYLKKYPKTKAGKGCLNFPDSAPIEMQALDLVIDAALGAGAKPHHNRPKASAASSSANAARKGKKSPAR